MELIEQKIKPKILRKRKGQQNAYKKKIVKIKRENIGACKKMNK